MAMVLVPQRRRVKRRRAREPFRGVARVPRLPPALRGRARLSGFYGRFSGAGAELKFLDTSKAFTAFTLAGVVFDDSLNHVAQGNTESQRVGRKVVARHLSFRGIVQSGIATTTTTTDNMYRIIVYCDKQANGAAAAVTDILETGALLSHYNLANQNRFKILYDQTRNVPINALGQTAAGTFSTVSTDFKWEINLKMNIPIEFDNTATDGSIATIRSNNIGIIGLSITDAGAPLLTYISRLRYSDAQ